MYSTCLFCHRSLGYNEAIETFAVGRRLAFDAEKGRLWVVCKRCGRWNLSPLEERWEAVEHCERLFRGTRLRVSTENIGMARAPDGTDLVRIGRSERPELAAWRYGDQFGRRHRRSLLYTTTGLAITVPLLWTGAYGAIATAVPGSALALQVVTWIQMYRARRAIVARTPTVDGEQACIRQKHLARARLVSAAERLDDGVGWTLNVRHDKGTSEIVGTPAIRLTGKVLARINKVGGGPKSVQQAVQRLELVGGSESLFERIAVHPRKEGSGFVQWWSGAGVRTGGDPPGTLRSLVVADRLALEMATNEESERRALEGELAGLEAAWKEAEEIASIADSLALPGSVDEFLRQHKE